MRLSATVRIGGESTSTYSNSVWSLFSSSAVSADDRTSAGLGGMGPHGMTERFGTPLTGNMASESWTRLVRHWTKPGLFFTPAARWQAGRRMSQSTIKTLLPRLERVAPRFTVVVVLPSPGSALVTSSSLGTGLAESRIDVRRDLKASTAMGSFCKARP